MFNRIINLAYDALNNIKSNYDWFFCQGIYSIENIHILASAGILDAEGHLPYCSHEEMVRLLAEAGHNHGESGEHKESV